MDRPTKIRFNAPIQRILECYAGPRVRRPLASKIIYLAEEIIRLSRDTKSEWSAIAECCARKELLDLVTQDQQAHNVSDGAPPKPGSWLWVVNVDPWDEPKVRRYVVTHTETRFGEWSAARNSSDYVIVQSRDGQVRRFSLKDPRLCFTITNLTAKLHEGYDKCMRGTGDRIDMCKRALTNAVKDLESWEKHMDKLQRDRERLLASSSTVLSRLGEDI